MIKHPLFDELKYWELPVLPIDLKTKWHDLLTGETKHLRFYENLTWGSKGPLLELGCGTGNLLPVWLRATRGFIYAIDKEQSFIEKAGLKLRGHPERKRLQLVCSDATKLPELPECSIIVAPLNFLAYLTTKESRLQCLKEMRRNVLKDGDVYVDIDPFPMALPSDIEICTFEQNMERVLVLKLRSLGRDPHVVKTQNLLIPFHSIKPWAGFIEVYDRIFPPTTELQNEFSQAGFRIEKTFGNQQGKLYEKGDLNRIFHLKPVD